MGNEQYTIGDGQRTIKSVMTSNDSHLENHDPLQPHSHDNNPEPPYIDPTMILMGPDGRQKTISLADLMADYEQTTIPAYTYMTDHGMHGPYKLEGVGLMDLINQELGAAAEWHEVEVISADEFGNRLYRHELVPADFPPVLLCHRSNNDQLRRIQGLVRLVVPSETDNALRQIKWVREIRVK